MPDPDRMSQSSLDEILAELRAREAGTRAFASDASGLGAIDTATLVRELRDGQRVIYGSDNRVDAYAITSRSVLRDADSVVALFSASDIQDNGDGTATLRTENYGARYGLCQREPFRQQPTGAFCSGFLVAPTVMATAGHCVNTNTLRDVRFVFGFRMTSATQAQTTVPMTEIYRGVRLVGREEEGQGPDWALVELDRPVTGHRVVRIRQTGKVKDGQAVHVIGHPAGLPAKYAPGAVVRNNQPGPFFVANLDTYGGNSGSPVFNSTTHMVEGILVRGETDFISEGNCRVSLVCPSSGCRGEDCTRTTVFARRLK